MVVLERPFHGALTVLEAARVAERCPETVRRWIREQSLGRFASRRRSSWTLRT